MSDLEILEWYHNTSEELKACVDQLLLEDLSSQGLIDSHGEVSTETIYLHRK